MCKILHLPLANKQYLVFQCKQLFFVHTQWPWRSRVVDICKHQVLLHCIQLGFEIQETEDISTLLSPRGGSTYVHTQFGSEDFPQNTTQAREVFKQTFFDNCIHGRRRYERSMKADCVYLRGWSSLKRFQLWKFYFKELCHFNFSCTLRRALHFCEFLSLQPNATGYRSGT